MLRQVSRRFGPDTAEQLMPVLERISDPEGIVLVADAVVECRTAEEFLWRVTTPASTAEGGGPPKG